MYIGNLITAKHKAEFIFKYVMYVPLQLHSNHPRKPQKKKDFIWRSILCTRYEKALGPEVL